MAASGAFLTTVCLLLAATTWGATILPEPEDDKVIKMGVILPFQGKFPWVLPRTRPAIDYAVDTVLKNGILPGYAIKVNEGDSMCSDTAGPLVAIDMYLKKQANVFLGPACDYSVAPIARFSPHWDIPIITGGALVHAFHDKSQYKLLTRISGSYAKVGECVATFFRRFDWWTIGLIYHNNLGARTKYGKTDCFFKMEAVYLALKDRIKMQDPSKEIWNKAFDENNPASFNITNLLLEAKLNTRVVVLCASPNSVREIMLKAADLNFHKGDYVFFNIDLFSSKNQSERPWYREDDTEERNQKALKAYEALMTVTLRKPDSKEYKKFSEEVKRRAKDQYQNFTYGEEEVNSFVGAFHDAVILYALALNETLAAGYNATDGAQITQRMWNRTFPGITGTVSIDENGDRNADYSLLDLNPETEKFEVVADYFGNKKQYEEKQPIRWPVGENGKQEPPRDVPVCGFDGSGCPKDEPFPGFVIAIIVLGTLLVLVSIVASLVYRKYRLLLHETTDIPQRREYGSPFISLKDNSDDGKDPVKL